MEKPTPKKAREKKCSRKKVLSWKASIFLSLWALGPGTEHPWMPESFIIWQLGSAVQFYLLAGGKRSTARSPHSQREIKTGRDGDKERESEKKRSFMQKTTTGVIHGHAWGLFYSASPSISSVCFVFRCTLAPEVKYLSLYNLQRWIAPSDGDVKSKVGEGAVC